MTRRLLVVGVLMALTGCGKFYYGKPGAGFVEFTQDHRSCTRDTALQPMNQPNPGSAYGLVSSELYRLCMKQRGWVREQKAEPGEGWFRGIEDSGVVQLDALPKQPWEEEQPARRGGPAGSQTNFGTR